MEVVQYGITWNVSKIEPFEEQKFTSLLTCKSL